MQGIANMLSVKINVLSTQYPTMLSIGPSSCNTLHEVYVGLIMQYHDVGLDKVSMHDEISDPEASSDNDGIPFARESEHNTSEADPLDDAVIEDDIRQITGGPQASMMSIENLEAFISSTS